MPRLSRIAAELPADDMHAALDFYEHKLGFQVAMRMPSGEYAIVERDGIAIHLFQDSSRKHSPVGIHIFTPDLEELRDELVSRGVNLSQDIRRKSWGNSDFRIKDDFGNEIKFTRPLPED